MYDKSSTSPIGSSIGKSENFPGFFCRGHFTAKLIDDAHGFLCHRCVARSQHAPAKVNSVFDSNSDVSAEQKGLRQTRIGKTANAERGPMRAFWQERLRIHERLRRAFKSIVDASDDLE